MTFASVSLPKIAQTSISVDLVSRRSKADKFSQKDPSLRSR